MAKSAITRGDLADDRGDAGRTRGRTIIELTERPDGTWTATQRGVHAVGEGRTATGAVKAYCDAIDEE